jgi:hypothetical protein
MASCRLNGNGSAGTGVDSGFPQIVELNVGGVFYSTSLSTLTSEPQSRSPLLTEKFLNLFKKTCSL